MQIIPFVDVHGTADGKIFSAIQGDNSITFDFIIDFLYFLCIQFRRREQQLVFLIDDPVGTLIFIADLGHFRYQISQIYIDDQCSEIIQS